MNELQNTTIQEAVVRRIPFLENFPFQDFSLEVGVLPMPQGAADIQNLEVIKFECEHGIKSTLSVFEKDIWFLNSISHNVTQLNDIKDAIDFGLSSEHLLDKRDSILVCELWTSTFDPESGYKFNYSTFTDVLNAMLNLKKVNSTELVEPINKLHKKRGIVRLTDEQEKILLSYYQFQLLYFKMVLGIIIASKISV